MEITAALVKELREITGAGMMDAKKALVATAGDKEKAIDFLREKGLAAAAKKADRIAAEGLVYSYIHGNGRIGVLVEVNCETDFVAKNADFIAVGEDIAKTAFDKDISEVTPELNDKLLDLATRVRENMNLTRLINVKAGADEYLSRYIHSDKKTGVIVVLKSDKSAVFADKAFQEFAYDCCLHAAAFTPLYVKKEDVDAAYIDEQLEVFRGQVAELQKPDNVKEGIVKGKLNKHLAEICFLEQAFVKDDKVSVAAKMKEVGKQLGANIGLSKLVLWQLGQ